MKKLFSMVLFLLIASAAHAQTHTVERVIDGNTIRLADGQEAHLIGLDISKVGYEATEHVRRWIEGKEVRLEFDAEEKNEEGRLQVYVFKRIEVEVDLAKAGKDLNRVIFPVDDEGSYEFFLNAVVISNGYAKVLESELNKKYSELFEELYTEAKKEKRGFWKRGHLRNIAQCAKAGGMLRNIKECDNSDSDWCIVSDTQQCYAHQVRNGKCSVGEYSEEMDAIVGITPRVLCDEEEAGDKEEEDGDEDK
jgi:endonuclease YncB( thermonuclease family)